MITIYTFEQTPLNKNRMQGMCTIIKAIMANDKIILVFVNVKYVTHKKTPSSLAVC